MLVNLAFKMMHVDEDKVREIILFFGPCRGKKPAQVILMHEMEFYFGVHDPVGISGFFFEFFLKKIYVQGICSCQER
jgi:hypothetical protein